MRFMMFSKSLQSMSVFEAGKTVKSLGFDGIELIEQTRADLAYLRRQAVLAQQPDQFLPTKKSKKAEQVPV